ncbi:hypothetical protein MPTK1_5g04980 [Marchantia polymorpha subsp. ruderalis]|uniref:F-box domain-containing protein n=2 Tax=Marchantia polymorpha TaxID=3197 RepID=A0AAF6BF24_MARPO|nr:hypothetical protein MARPO_0027s0129 [Marchantia polymorpha]BBN10608.1 hypothetical protein Mp_5g04980 [Marchantia polymorpha subsp. ruderalis]|eukprot:PTQ43027.1 hypothetical protein MARPO_0027s0129 [Marchantia polymorpha]
MDYEMDSRVWRYLPVDLLMVVLAYLPHRTLAKFRLVCKKWCEFWDCSQFGMLRSQRAPREKYVLFIRNYANSQPEIHYYDPMLNKLMNSPLRYFPSQVNHLVLATSRGLLFSVQFPSPRCTSNLGECAGGCWPHRGCDMIVSNPLRKDCARVLPARLYNWPLCVVGMISDTDGYKIIMGNSGNGTEIYDSVSRSWKLIPRTDDSTTPLPRIKNSAVISRNGCLLYVGVPLYNHHQWNISPDDLHTVCVFNPTSERWSFFDLPHSEVGWKSIQLEDCGGRLFLVCHKNPTSHATETFSCYADVCVWERLGQDPVTGFWEEQLAPSPDSLHFPVHNLNVVAEYLTVPMKSEDFLCFSRGVQGAVFSFQEEFQQMSIYNPTLSSWWSTMDRFCDHSEHESLFEPITEYMHTTNDFHLYNLLYEALMKCRIMDRELGNFGGHSRYSADLLFEPRIEALP